MNLKISALGAAVAAAIASTSVQAAEVVTFDPSLKISYKNNYWNEDYDYKNVPDGKGGLKPDNVRDEWVHAVIADFDTGYVNNVIGAVITASIADPISVKKGSSISNVAKGENGSANGISGFQQAYIKAQHAFAGIDTKASLGVKKRGTELYGNSGSRILNASSYGFDVSGSFANLNVYATQITGASDRNESSFKNDLGVDNIRILGGNYSIAGVGLTAEQLRSKDYVKKNFLKADYTFDMGDEMSVDTDIRYGTAKSAGNLGDADKVAGSAYYNLNATLNIADAFVGMGYNKTTKGDWTADNNPGNVGNADTFNSSLDLWETYADEGEKAYVLKAGYDFAALGVPGLNVEVLTAKGKDASNTDKFNRREYSSHVSYKFDGQLEGLSLAWYHYDYKLDKREEGESLTKKVSESGDRLYLSYSVAVF